MTPQEIQTWRKALRLELLAKREALPRATLEDYRRSIDGHLLRTLPDSGQHVIGFCWPYKNEYDARHLLADLRRRGVTTVLPAIIAPKSPLVFRQWQPGVTLKAGPLGIPFPADSPEMQPDIVLLPVVGFDAAGYRLGYGGGYFDRTLAAIPRKPRVIALAYEMLFIETIHPQPHDVPVDYVVTERGVYVRRSGDGLRFTDRAAQGYSSPPCYATEIAPDGLDGPQARNPDS